MNSKELKLIATIHQSLDDKKRIGMHLTTIQQYSENTENRILLIFLYYTLKIILSFHSYNEPIKEKIKKLTDLIENKLYHIPSSNNYLIKSLEDPISSSLIAEGMTTKNGHTFSQNTIQKIKKDGLFLCPITRDVYENNELIENKALNYLISQFCFINYQNPECLILLLSNQSDHHFSSALKEMISLSLKLENTFTYKKAPLWTKAHRLLQRKKANTIDVIEALLKSYQDRSKAWLNEKKIDLNDIFYHLFYAEKLKQTQTFLYKQTSKKYHKQLERINTALMQLTTCPWLQDDCYVNLMICPVSKIIMTAPIILPCGRSVDLTCLENNIHEDTFVSPIDNNTVINTAMLRPNRNLQSFIEDYTKSKKLIANDKVFCYQSDNPLLAHFDWCKQKNRINQPKEDAVPISYRIAEENSNNENNLSCCSLTGIYTRIHRFFYHRPTIISPQPSASILSTEDESPLMHQQSQSNTTSKRSFSSIYTTIYNFLHKGTQAEQSPLIQQRNQSYHQ